MALISLGLTLPICKMGLGSLQVFPGSYRKLTHASPASARICPATQVSVPHSTRHTHGHIHMGHMGTRGTHTYPCGDEAEVQGKRVATASWLFAPFPCTCLAFSNKHHPNSSLPTTFHLGLHIFQLCFSGGHRKGLPASHLIPKAPSGVGAGASVLGLLLNVTLTSNLMPHRHLPAGRAHNDDPSQPPLTYCLPDLSFQLGSQSGDPAFTDFANPQPLHARQAWSWGSSRRPQRVSCILTQNGLQVMLGRTRREGDPTPPGS